MVAGGLEFTISLQQNGIQIRSDRRRYRAMDALRRGQAPPPPATDDFSQRERLFWQAMPFDPDLFRAGIEIVSALTLPHVVYARPGIMDRAEAVVRQLPPDAPGRSQPSRADLLAALN